VFACVSQGSPKKLVGIAGTFIFAGQVLFPTFMNSFKADLVLDWKMCMFYLKHCNTKSVDDI